MSSSSSDSSSFSGSDSESSCSAKLQLDKDKASTVEHGLAQAQTAGLDEIEEASKLDEYFRQKLRNKLIVEFKAELPVIETGLRDNNPNLLRIPSFMTVEVQPYEADTYASSDELVEPNNDPKMHAAFLTRLKTTLRWRISLDASTGVLFKESNARFVRWSDGSQTFHVGAEAFDVVQHPVSGNQHQLYIRLGNYYLPQCAIKEKLTLRPKLEPNFGLSHMQGLRRRDACRPLSSCVKLLMELTTNPVLERKRKVMEERIQKRKEKCQLNQLKPCVTPMRHCTADDSDGEIREPAPYQETSTALHEARRNAGGIRTNRNTNIKFPKYEKVSESEDESMDEKARFEEEIE